MKDPRKSFSSDVSDEEWALVAPYEPSAGREWAFPSEFIRLPNAPGSAQNEKGSAPSLREPCTAEDYRLRET